MSFPDQPRAVVTGAAHGLGRALCLELARRSARIVVADVDAAGAEETAQEIARSGGQAAVVRCDVSSAEQVEALARFADERFGGTDLLVNNAGVAAIGSTGDVPLGDWQWVFGINVWGAIHGCHSFIPRMRAQRSGHILNVASAAGFLSAPNLGPYNVSKAAVISLSETLFGELRPFDVGVTVLCPTYFQSNIFAHERAAQRVPELTAQAAQMMAGSKLQAAEIARLALASCQRGDLYCLPMSDGRWAWRIKRWTPESFFKLLPRIVRLFGRLVLPAGRS